MLYVPGGRQAVLLHRVTQGLRQTEAASCSHIIWNTSIGTVAGREILENGLFTASAWQRHASPLLSFIGQHRSHGTAGKFRGANGIFTGLIVSATGYFQEI